MLDAPLTAFFASRTSSGTAIRAAMDWAVAQVRTHQAVVSGFHSPVEQAVLRLCMQASSPAVAVIARPVAGARLGRDWVAGIEAGHLVVVSAQGPDQRDRERLTAVAAKVRNDVAARLASRIVISQASVGGQLADQVAVWQAEGLRVDYLIPS